MARRVMRRVGESKVVEGLSGTLPSANRSAELPAEWRAFSPAGLAAIGDQFVERREAAVLIVPSVLVPSESHPQFGLIRVHLPEPFGYDQRLF